MKMFYKITPLEASGLGYFVYAVNQAFDPFCSEQKDGDYIMSKLMYDILKTHEKFSGFSVSGKTELTKEDVETNVKTNVKTTNGVAKPNGNE